MKIADVEEFRALVKKGTAVPAVLVAGGDLALHDGVVGVLTDDLRARGSDVSVVRLDAGPVRTDAWQRLADTAASLPMFGEGFVVVVANCEGAKLAPELKQYLASPPDHVRLVLFADKKAATTGLGKAIAAAGHVMVPQEMKDPAAERLALQMAREAGLLMDAHAAAALVDMVGADRSALEAAFQSLAGFKGKGGLVGDEDLRGLVSRVRQTPTWELDDAINARDLARALKVAGRLLEDAKPGEGPVKLLHMIVRQARQILVARDLIRRRVDAKASMERLGLRMPFHWEKLERAARKYGAQELEDFVRRAPDLEILVKRSGSNAAPEAVLTWILSLLMRPAAARPAADGNARRAG